jgi:hypothetical protein
VKRFTPLLAALLFLGAAPAAAQPFPARSGESGLLDVPSAEVVGRGGGSLAAELRLDKVTGQPTDLGPLPLYVTGGVSNRLELGLSAREWGQPGDPRPAQMLFGAALKFQLLRPEERTPGLALSAYLDRIGVEPVGGLRLAVSTPRLGPVKIAAFLGGEAGDGSGLTAGAALSAALPGRTELVGEYVTGPRGPNIGGALRWRATPTVGFGLGVNYLPDDDGVRFAFTVAFAPPARPILERAAKVEKKAEEAPTAALIALGDRPSFKLKIHTADPAAMGEPRHRQHGVRTAVAEQLPQGPKALTTPQATGPSAEDVFESQLRDQESAADARERRLKATEESLRQRESAAVAEGQQLESRDQQLAAREVQLDAREKRVVLRGPPTQAERAIEAREAQLGAQERQLAAQERGFQPTLDTAAGRERDATAREALERADAQRLGDEWKRAKDRVAQLDVRRQALSARQRQLAATEARLLAMGERIDALERQIRTRAERLDAWQRRLDARAERLELLERRSADQRKPTDTGRTAETTPAPTAPDVKAAKDKAVFVMVVKAPTAIVKEKAAGVAPATGAPSAPASGAAVEKAVAAATVVAFPTPTSELSELDRESIENIAKLAARENCELLVWARAKNPALLAEAQRRADGIKKLAMSAAQLESKRVVTRVTTRPGAVGVDVVVSALREQGAKPAQPATPAGAPASGQAAIQMLGTGETGKRQIRDAVLRAQPAIETCVGEQIQRKNLQRAEGVLKLTAAANGRIVIVKASEGDLSGVEMETCLTEAAKAWQFPAAEGEYVVDVPITVIGGGAK